MLSVAAAGGGSVLIFAFGFSFADSFLRGFSFFSTRIL